MFKHVSLSLFLLLLSACSQEKNSGPAEVRWDRETCTRCDMAIGDRHYAAQVRSSVAGEKSKLYKFDDIGCAIIWLDDKPWRDDAGTEIWVKDHRNGEWLDARQANYVKDKISPMNYGLGAQPEATADTLNYSKAISHIVTGEQQHHQHGGHMPMSEK